MNFEISFLDKRGNLSCLMNMSFFSLDHASHYARDVMTRDGRERSIRTALVNATAWPFSSRRLVNPTVRRKEPA